MEVPDPRPIFNLDKIIGYPTTPVVIVEAELASIEEVRLRLKEARNGETVADVVRRTGARWTADEAAVANDLEKGTRFNEAALVKVPLAQAYSSRD